MDAQASSGRQKWRNGRCLIIGEISMVSERRLGLVDEKLRDMVRCTGTARTSGNGV